MGKSEVTANVLLVDDEEQFLKLLSQRLQSRGMRVESAGGGEEALQKVQSESFDAIVLDLAMPGIDGIETLRRIKEANPEMQIIMLTGHATVKSGIEAMKLGAEDYLEKPVDLNELLEKIGAAKHKKAILVEKSRQDDVKKIIKSKGW